MYHAESEANRIVTIVENIGRRKHWRIWQIDNQLPNFFPQVYGIPYM